MTARLSGRCVLITGGASGLGLSTGKAALKAGARVVIADIQPQPQAVKELGDDDKVRYVQCDVSDWDSQVKLFQEASAFAGQSGLDTVAIFAGIDNQKSLVEHVKASADVPVKPDMSTFDINLQGSLYTATLALHHLRQTSSGTADKNIVFISSLAGYLDVTHNSLYTASKFGVRGLFRSIRHHAHTELGVRCNMLAPWAMRTPMTAEREKLMEGVGIKEGEGIHWAPHEVLIDAVLECVTDSTVVGKAFAIMPEGFIDLYDDREGEYAGPILKRLLAKRDADGDRLQL